MPLPTLAIKGNLRSPTGDPEIQKELDEWIPIDYLIDWFRKRLSLSGINNRVLVLKSETASGKSTLFPPELYKRLIMGKDSPGAVCSQPRVATAIENVMEILLWNAKELQLGRNIGWQTKYNRFRPKDVGLLSATVGTVQMQLKSMTDEEIMAKYRYIMIDETHERDLQTDMTIYLLKNLLKRNQNNPKCPFVVFMSATFDPGPFMKYFDLTLANNFIWCAGMTAPILEKWNWNEGRTVNDYPRAASTVVEQILAENPDDPWEQADVLIFLPGAAEFKLAEEWLNKVNKAQVTKGLAPFNLLKIDGPAFQQQNRDFMLVQRIPTPEHEVHINGKKYKPGRRVILTTNVAETGLTLSNLKYVIDSGYNREIEFNPVYGTRGLITKPAPHSRQRQRRGRAGRKFDGVFYPLYPKFIYDMLPVQQLPQILVNDISDILLDIINEQIKAKTAENRPPEFLVADIDMLDQPTPDAITAGLEKLYTLGFIAAGEMKPSEANNTTNNSQIFTLTELGKVAAGFNMVPPESVRMILSAWFWQCSVLDVLTIAAWLVYDPKDFTAGETGETGETATDPQPQKKLPKPEINWAAVYKLGLPGYLRSANMMYKARLMIADEFIHGAILYNALKQVIVDALPSHAAEELKNWCRRNNLSYKTCISFVKARDDLIEQVIALKLDVFANESESLRVCSQETFMDTITRLKYCIYDGYRGNLLVLDGPRYTTRGLNVVKPTLFSENEKKIAEQADFGFVAAALPTYLLYKKLTIKENPKTGIFDVRSSTICMLDGFISPDIGFSM